MLRSVANSICPMLEFEDDVASNYADGRLPILDLKVWVETGENGVAIRHSFYKKPMASKLTLQARTAFPTSQVRAIMVEETLRRLRNCDPETSWEERGRHLTDFAVSMKSSGHTEHFRRIVFNKAVARFCKELDAHEAGSADLYRSREERLKQLEYKGGKTSKDNWFRRKEGEDEKVTSVFRVPYTAGGKLRETVTKSLKANAAPTGLKTRVQEDRGSRLTFKIVKPDPFPRENCQRDTCPITRGEQQCHEQCFQAHSNYTILCARCDSPGKAAQTQADTPPPQEESSSASEEDGEGVHGDASAPAGPQSSPSAVYLGETSRGCHERFCTHVSNYKSSKGFMWEHVLKAHGGHMGEVPANDFYMQRCSVDKDPIRRVVRESVRIKNARKRAEEGGGPEVFNGKGEFFGVKVVTVEFKQE